MGIAVWLNIKDKIYAQYDYGMEFFWALNSTSQITYEKIIKDSKLFLALIGLNIIIGLIAGFFFLPLPNIFEDRDIYYGPMFFKTYLPSNISPFLCYLYYASLPIIIFMLLNNTFALVCAMCQSKYQAILLNDVLTQFFNNEHKIEEDQLLYNSEYQDLVFQKMKYCIQHYKIIKQ